MHFNPKLSCGNFICGLECMWLFKILCVDQLASNQSNNLKNMVTHTDTHTPFLFCQFLHNFNLVQTCLLWLWEHDPPSGYFPPSMLGTALSSSLVPRLLRAAGLGTRRIEVILRIAAVSLCVEFVCRALAANDYQYYLLNWRTKKSEVRQRQRRVCCEEVRVCYIWYGLEC